MAEISFDARNIAIIALLALATIWLANNVEEIGRLVMPKYTA